MLNLSDARKCFRSCQKLGNQAFVIKKHCWADHPNRGFTTAEVLRLLLGGGHLKDNRFPTAQPNSFLWVCKDDDGDNVEIAVIIESKRIKAIAISAYRKDKL